MQDERDLPYIIETTKGKDGTYKPLKKEVSLKGSMVFIVTFGSLMWMQMNNYSKESIIASVVIGTIGGTMEWAYWRKRAKLHKMQAEKQEISERDQIFIKILSKLDRVVIHLEHYFCWYILCGFILYLLVGGFFLATPSPALQPQRAENTNDPSRVGFTFSIPEDKRGQYEEGDIYSKPDGSEWMVQGGNLVRTR